MRIPASGFGDPVRDAQRVFRAALDALARPTLPQRLGVELAAPGTLSPAAGALLLALADDSTPVWLDGPLAGDADVTDWLAFHTAAPVVAEAREAVFAVVSDSRALPPLESFSWGTDVAPNLSATVIAVVKDGADVVALAADGPGFPEPAAWDAPVAPGFLAAWQANAAAFPSGVDLFLAGSDTVTGLPRTTQLKEA